MTLEKTKIDDTTVELVNRQNFRKDSLIEEKKALQEKIKQIDELLSVFE
jgi:hypothetical protein|tara:strand:- start:192 stop:338 length:147 start_codon:yes stop_codon:yes gene_type:complete